MLPRLRNSWPAGAGRGNGLPWSLQRKCGSPHQDFGLLGSRTGRLNFCHFKSRFVVICYGRCFQEPKSSVSGTWLAAGALDRWGWWAWSCEDSSSCPGGWTDPIFQTLRDSFQNAFWTPPGTSSSQNILPMDSFFFWDSFPRIQLQKRLVSVIHCGITKHLKPAAQNSKQCCVSGIPERLSHAILAQDLCDIDVKTSAGPLGPLKAYVGLEDHVLAGWCWLEVSSRPC